MSRQTQVQSMVRNGVNLEGLRQTIRAIQAQPDLAAFQFRAANRWVMGGYNQTAINTFSGAGQEHREGQAGFSLDHDEPPVLLGEDKGANPVDPCALYRGSRCAGRCA